MDSIRIVAKLYFENGQHGFEENYNDLQTIEDYRNSFIERTKLNTNSKYVVLHYLDITINDKEGNVLRDEKTGDRIMKRIYLNEDFHSRYMDALLRG
ncbi:MAG: hypothetical protein J0L67_05920 [Cytophagales bacterium]|nr:hypothetical protein [Cytophagales bacterium]